MFSKVLIANRGEIACRIIRGCQSMGVRAVAVYSDADRDALHVEMADESYHIGPPKALESYLNQDKIIEAARKTGAEAVHPGYGFLAENFAFAKRCAAEGVKFIGPDGDSIQAMGDKAHARALVGGSGVPIIPGTEATRSTSMEVVRQMALDVGLPVMVKPAAGGGGIGMHIIETPEQLNDMLLQAEREAQAAFGDPAIYVEKYIPEPRHVEFQIMADEKGNTVHFFERECSIQRRHQKLVEEHPSPGLPEETRQHMGESAVAAAKAANYSNAGTVEFLMDPWQSFYYFLEMNTRLQVEHPVTEMVTGVDLVHIQLKVAAGERLPLKQEDITRRGAAIECRIYAEDPSKNFMPSPGKITHLEVPVGEGIRVENGVKAGYEVSWWYDPLLAKLVTWGETRDQAIERMKQALEGFVVGGIVTNISLHQQILSDPGFVAGHTDTNFLPRMFSQGTGQRS